MSRALRKQLFKIVSLFEDANKVLEKLLPHAGGREEEITGLLSDCQDGAVSIGNSIEALYGDGTESVKKLEEYCENLYQLAISLGNVVRRRELFKLLKIRVKMLKKALGEEVSDKLEVVFLPYKASMWDSLESVWIAARDDKEAEAFVIPIPYYDKNPDGSFREMHYEGDLYPDYVPVTRYQEYNFELRRPDIIFIHNPYDECNHVTSVHPFFYSKNLKKFTEKLVYIPYYILDEIKTDDETKINWMSQFCFLPGIIYADKVFVQSEEMRKIYVDEFCKEALRLGVNIDKIKIDRKISGIGSPKFDKLVKSQEIKLQIPEEWLKIILKKDGGKKKVIFYNTCVTALLKYNEKLLEKIEITLDCFKERRDQVTLLWRPHPLFESTLKALRPNLLEKYNEIVMAYRYEKWGIYDDSPDLDRAILIADCYYGDFSSVVSLFKKIGKTTIIQNMYCLRQNNIANKLLLSTDAVIDEKFIWLSSNYTNALMKCNLDTNELCEVYFFPDEPAKNYLFISFANAGKDIYFAPYNARELWKFDSESKEFQSIDIGLSDEEKNITRKFTLMIHSENNLFLFGRDKLGIVIVNLETGEVQKNLDFIETLKTLGVDTDNTIFCENYQIVENTIFIPLENSNIIMTFHMIERKAAFYSIGTQEDYAFRTITRIDNDFILTNCNDEEIIWNPKIGVKARRNLRMLGLKPMYYKRVFIYEDKVIYISFNEYKIGIYNNYNSTLNILPFTHSNVYTKFNKVLTKFEFIIKNKNYLYLQVRDNGDYYRINLNTEICEQGRFILKDEERDDILLHGFASYGDNLIYETDFININNYLQIIDKQIVETEYNQINCGKKIWKMLCQGDKARGQ